MGPRVDNHSTNHSFQIIVCRHQWVIVRTNSGLISLHLFSTTLMGQIVAVSLPNTHIEASFMLNSLFLIIETFLVVSICFDGSTFQQHGQCVSGRPASAGTISHAATLKQKLQIKLASLPSHSILILGNTTPSLTLWCQPSGRVAANIPSFLSLAWHDSRVAANIPSFLALTWHDSRVDTNIPTFCHRHDNSLDTKILNLQSNYVTSSGFITILVHMSVSSCTAGQRGNNCSCTHGVKGGKMDTACLAARCAWPDHSGSSVQQVQKSKDTR